MKSKTLPIAGALLLFAASVFAITSAYDPIRTPVAATTVSVSTSAWTLVPATATSGRTLIHFSNPASNTGAIVMVVSTSTAVPAEATTVRPHEFQPGEGDWFHFYGGLYFWALSLHTSAESFHVQEYKQ